MKYIDITTIGPDNFQVWACHDGTKTVVMVDRHSGKLQLDRRALGLRVKKGYQPPAGTPGSFTRDEAISIAHQIGRYFFKFGDLVYAYTYVNGLRNEDFFVEGLNKALGRQE